MKIPFKSDQNSESIDANQLLGINRLVKLSVMIDGEHVPHYTHFTLSQHTQTHHRFELTLDYDSFGFDENHNLENTNKLLGKRITVFIRYKDLLEEKPERMFIGVVTSVGFSQESASLGNIVLTGYSPTILLDGAPHTQSFGGDLHVNTNIIATDVIKQGLGTSFYEVRIKPKNHSTILYSTQYKETHYNYLCRIATAYNEQFYYDGETLHFGEMPPPNKPFNLVYGRNVNGVKVQTNAVHTKPVFYGYNSSANAELTSGQTPITHRGTLARKAYENNENIFRTKSLQVAPLRAGTDMDVVNAQRSEWGQKGVEVLTITGSTTIPFLFPGCVADLEMRIPGSNKTSYFTRIMITDVEHEIDALGHYNGQFKAIAADTGYLPKPYYDLSSAEPQIATVVSNADPIGQGRVKVRFEWQMHETTDFIRVMTPDAGGTDQITQNRGYVAIPEVGDQVVVGFTEGHPDRPFVLGSMFHGKVGLGGGINNQVKSIQTRSGIRILMNDGEGSVTIIDPSGNTYLMDGNGNINVTAPNDINFNAGANFNISVGQNMTTTVGANQTNTVNMNKKETVVMSSSTSVGAMYNLSVLGNFSSTITGNFSNFVKGDMEVRGDKEHKVTSLEGLEINTEGTIAHHSKKEVQNNSGENSKSF